MKVWFFYTLCFIVLLVSCGTGKVLRPPILEQGHIRNLSISDNILSFTTEDSSFVYVTYTNHYDQTDRYRGWSAGKKALEHSYILPVRDSGLTYNIKLSVSGNNTYADTTWTFTSSAIEHPLLAVHFINVQQGDAILIETPDDKYLQIDGGYGRRGGQGWQGGGVPIALNYLQDMGVTHLDYIIESHNHLDHYGGLIDIRNSSITYDKYVSNSTPEGYTYGMSLELNSVVDFQILNFGFPPTASPSEQQGNINNTSIVIKATYGDAEFLFTGDALSHVQDWMYSQNYDISVDVLKASHHGARSHGTTDAEYLSRTLNQYAKIAVLSYGAGNGYYHPAELIRFTQVQVFGTNPPHPNSPLPPGNTDNFFMNAGHIVAYSDGKMIYIKTER